jgi:hypothetical protein
MKLAIRGWIFHNDITALITSARGSGSLWRPTRVPDSSAQGEPRMDRRQGERRRTAP